MGRLVVWATVICAQCAVEFRTKPCDVRSGRRFCSRACAGLASGAINGHMMRGNQFAFLGDQAGRMAMHYRARLLTKDIAQCNRCPALAQLTHHRDGNPRNNVPDNLERLCRRCHIAHHRPELEAAKAGAA